MYALTAHSDTEALFKKCCFTWLYCNIAYIIVYSYLSIWRWISQIPAYIIMWFVVFVWSVCSTRSKYIPQLACPGLISADSEERMHTCQAPSRQCPGVTSVHVQYMCRRIFTVQPRPQGLYSFFLQTEH